MKVEQTTRPLNRNSVKWFKDFIERLLNPYLILQGESIEQRTAFTSKPLLVKPLDLPF